MWKILLLCLFCSVNVCAQDMAPKMIETAPAADNQKVIDKYTRFRKLDRWKSSYEDNWGYAAVWGVKKSSVMSNEDIEVNFIRKWMPQPDFNDVEQCYFFVEIKNKTNKTIYIDRENCFRIYQDGTKTPYYTAKDAGKRERVIAIPANKKKYLTEYKYETKKAGYIDFIECPENFEWSMKEAGLNPGNHNHSVPYQYDEDNTPLTRRYVISYSKDESLTEYSAVAIDFYIMQIFVTKMYSDNLMDEWIVGCNKNTITSCCRWYKESL